MPEGIPQTGGYMIAAYIVTAVILVGYTVVLIRRTGAQSRRVDAQTQQGRTAGD